MRLVWQTYKTSASDLAKAMIRELDSRFRSLRGAPIRLVVIMPGEFGALDAIVICGSKRGVTWAWLAYDCLPEAGRLAVRMVPYTMADGLRNVFVADLMREFLGWERRKRRKR